ncbi:MAG: ROK family transcriptional regulator [Rhizobiaceae bacterium]|nr:ROK family transcriptional regulator [Rhizobiaceae bacterium]
MNTIVRPDDVRRQNQLGVLLALRRRGGLSRTELSAATGLSASTVTVITNSLIERGVIAAEQISELPAQRRGRPQIRLAPNPSHASVAVILLALNRVTADIYDYGGGVIASTTVNVKTKSMTGEQLIGATISTLGALLDGQGHGIGPLARISVGVEGIVDGAGRVFLSSPVIDEQNIPLGEALEREFMAPTELANECNMIAEALRWRAPERYGPNFAAVVMTIGIGMGLYLNGHLFSGITSSATEFGHICYKPGGALCRCGRRGCVEAYAGQHSIWRAAMGADTSRMLAEEPTAGDMRRLADRARSAPGPERDAFEEAGRAIGTGLSNLFSMFDPIPLVFAGPGVQFMDLMKESITTALDNPSYGLPVTISVIDEDPDHVALTKAGNLMSALTFLDANIPGAGDVPDASARTGAASPAGKKTA